MVEKSDKSKMLESRNKIYQRYVSIAEQLKKKNESGTKPQYKTNKRLIEEQIMQNIVGQKPLTLAEQKILLEIFNNVHKLEEKSQFKIPDLQNSSEQQDVLDILQLEVPGENISDQGQQSSKFTRITDETKATMAFLKESKYSNLVDKLANDPLFSSTFKDEAKQMKNKTLKVDEEMASKIHNFIEDQSSLDMFKNAIEKIKAGPKIEIHKEQKQQVVEKQKPTLYERNPQLKAYVTQQMPKQEREYFDVETNKIYYPMSQNISEQEKFMKEAFYKIRYMDPEKRKQYKNVLAKYEVIGKMMNLEKLYQQDKSKMPEEEKKYLSSIYKQYIPQNDPEHQKLFLKVQQQENYINKLKSDLSVYEATGKNNDVRKTKILIPVYQKKLDPDIKKLNLMTFDIIQKRAQELIAYRVKLQEDVDEEEAKQGQKSQDVQNQLVQAEGKQQHALSVDILGQNNQQTNLQNLDQFPAVVKQQQKTIYEKNYESMFPFLEAILQEEQQVQHLTAEQKRLSLSVLDQMEKDPQFFLQQFDFLKKQFDQQPYSSQENARLEQEQQFLKRQAGNIQYFPLNEKTKQYIFSTGGVPWKTNKEYAEEQKQFLGRNQITGDIDDDEKKVQEKPKHSEIDSKQLVRMIQNLVKYTGKIGGTIDPEETDLQKYLNKTSIFTPEIKKLEPTQFSFSNSSFRLRACE